jgi:hypothetical protein
MLAAVSGPAGFSEIPEFPGCLNILRYVVRACGHSTGEQTQQACHPESESGLRSAERFSIQVLNGSSEFSVLVELGLEIQKLRDRSSNLHEQMFQFVVNHRFVSLQASEHRVRIGMNFLRSMSIRIKRLHPSMSDEQCIVLRHGFCILMTAGRGNE